MSEISIKDLVKRESSKVDFKRSWYEQVGADPEYNRKSKNEMVKDIIALHNGGLDSIGKDGFLIIGYDEQSKEFFDVDIKDNKGNLKGEHQLEDEITNYLKNYANFPITLEAESFIGEEKKILVITIKNCVRLVHLKKQLETPKPKEPYGIGTVFYRYNKRNDVASPEIIKEFNKLFDVINKSSKDALVQRSNETIKELPEIKIQAKDILELIVSPRDQKNLSENLGKSDKKESIHYEYYELRRRERTEGFLFLGKRITIKNVFADFSLKIQDNRPDELEIFLPKQTKDNRVVDRKKSISDICKRYSLMDIDKERIYYYDEFVLENTDLSYDNSDLDKRDDFIDQNLYKTINPNNKDADSELLPKQSIGWFYNILIENEEDNRSPISIVYGSGGVGKTTFCDSLKYSIVNDNKNPKRVFHIKGEDIVSTFSSIPENKEIKGLDDLYDLYRGDLDDFRNISMRDFKLNLIVGNIIVIIDAIEEIESAFKERFQLEMFFQSLQELHNRFLSTKIIITTREHFIPRIQEVEEELEISIDYYQLQGFKENNLKNFLEKKYKSQQSKIKQITQFIEFNKLFIDGHIIPLFVHWTCLVVDREDLNKSNLDEYEYKYLIKQNKIDNLIILLLLRERDKQSLKAEVNDLLDLFVEIILVHNGQIKHDEFHEYIILTFGEDEDSKSYLKNPLLTGGELIKLKYDILSDLIKSRYIIHIFKKIEEDNFRIRELDYVITVLKDCYQGTSGIFIDIIDNLFNCQVNILKVIKYLVSLLTDELKDDQVVKSKKENIYRTISALHYLFISLKNPVSSEDRTQNLIKIYGLEDLTEPNIRFLYIYGEFYSLDFQNIKVSDSCFDSFSNFYKSKFPSDNKVIFYDTSFKNCNYPQTQNIKKDFFDKSCAFINSNMSEICEINTQKGLNNLEQLKKDIISIVKSISTSKKSINLIKKRSNISYSKGLSKLITELLEIELLEKEDRAGNEPLFKIRSVYHDNIADIKLGVFPEILDDFLKNKNSI